MGIADDGQRRRRLEPSLCPARPTRRNQLFAGGYQGILCVDHGANEKGEAGNREEARGPSRRALRSKQSTRKRCNHVARKTLAGGRPHQVALWRDLGAARLNEPSGNPRQEPLPQGLLSLAASEPSGRRNGFSQIRNKRGREAGGARPDPV